MAYNLSTIRSKVLTNKLDDTTFPTGVVDDFINDTQRDIFNTYELSFQEKTDTIAVTTGNSVFDFPTDYQQEQSMVITGATNRELGRYYMDFRDFNLAYPVPTANSQAAPTNWTIYAKKLRFSAPSNGNYTISLFYLKTPTTLINDADVPEIPEEFSELLVLGAYMRVLARNEDFDQANYIKNSDYSPMLDKMVARYGKKQTGTPMQMGPMRAQQRRASRS